MARIKKGVNAKKKHKKILKLAKGYRGRAAYKILELDDKYRFLVPGARVVDLGCAPGGWCQVAVARVNALGEKSGKRVGRVLGVDLQEVDPIAGAEIHQLDFLSDGADDKVFGAALTVAVGLAAHREQQLVGRRPQVRQQDQRGGQ